MHTPLRRRALLALPLAALTSVAAAQAPAPGPAAATPNATPNPAAPAASPVRVRATIEKIDLPRITVRERNGEVLTLTLADNLTINEVVPIEMSAIQPGSFIGTAALTKADGTLEALEVLVFPEAARGSGEGHYPWDLMPQSTMTNATVSGLSQLPKGRELTLRYKDGEKKVVVPEDVPIVTFKPGDASLIVVGARIFGAAVLRDGLPTMSRINIGRNGFAPPM
jgi:hypothetical protein